MQSVMLRSSYSPNDIAPISNVYLHFNGYIVAHETKWFVEQESPLFNQINGLDSPKNANAQVRRSVMLKPLEVIFSIKYYIFHLCNFQHLRLLIITILEIFLYLGNNLVLILFI